MSLDPATLRALRMLARTRTKAEMALLFAQIRQHSDQALFAILAAPPPKKQAPKDFARDIAARLAPIVAPAEEKADLLIEALAETHGPVAIAIDGLVPTIRKLAARHGEAAVAAAADVVLARQAAWGSSREKVT